MGVGNPLHRDSAETQIEHAEVRDDIAGRKPCAINGHVNVAQVRRHKHDPLNDQQGQIEVVEE